MSDYLILIISHLLAKIMESLSTLDKIFLDGGITKPNGEFQDLTGATRQPLCKFIQDIVNENDFKHTLEVGFAQGISALAILDMTANRGGTHIAIDPFQFSEYYDGIGVEMIKRAGYSSNFTLFDTFTYLAVPKLIESKYRIDFAYVDTTKLLDYIMTDFLLIDKILKLNGVIIFDDIHSPGIKVLIRFIAQLPNYELVDTFPSNAKADEYLQSTWEFNMELARRKIYTLDNLQKDYELGLNGIAIAFRKTSANDGRHWSWFPAYV